MEQAAITQAKEIVEGMAALVRRLQAQLQPTLTEESLEAAAARLRARTPPRPKD